MGVQIPVGGSQAAIRWLVSGDSEVMVCTLGIVDTTGARTPFQIATDFSAAVTAGNWVQPTDMLVGYVKQQEAVTTVLPTGPVTVLSGSIVAGTAVGNALPNNCAILASKVTALGGRRNRGRMYLPPFRVDESQVSQTGVIQPASVATIQGELAQFVLELNARNLRPTLWHSDGGAGSEITSFQVQGTIATQRTRMRR